MLDDLGAARFGPIYLAQADQRLVVVKVFDQNLTDAERAALVEALERLCQLPLTHAAITAPLAAGDASGVAYLVEDYLEATPLSRLLRRDGPQPLGDAVLRITQVAGALDFAAAVGVHHGVLHARDILVAEDTTRLTGLGLVQAFAEAGLDVPVRGPGVSPARAAGEQPTAADDIYSLAAITFELVYGRPWPGLDAMTASVTPVTGVDHHRLRQVLADALAEDPARRPQTALGFAASLQDALLESRVTGDEVPPVAERFQDVEPQSPAPRLMLDSFDPEPVEKGTDAGDDLPLRKYEPELAAPVERVEQPAPVYTAPERPVFAAATSEPPAGRSKWPVAAALVLGILGGYAAGFVMGQRQSLPEPRSVARVAPRSAQPGSATPASPAPTQPESPAAAGERFTDTEVVTPSEPMVTEPPMQPQPREATPARQAPAAPAPGRTPGPTSTAVAAAAPDPDTTGRVLVRSMPSGARVAVDGEPRGVTPLAVRALALGTHTIEVTHAGYDSGRQQVVLTSVQPARSMDFELRPAGRSAPASAPPRDRPAAPVPAPAATGEPGALQIESRPARAQVYLDNRLIGTTPMLISNVPAGIRRVRIEMPGYQGWSGSVNVVAGERARIAASLEERE